MLCGLDVREISANGVSELQSATRKPPWPRILKEGQDFRRLNNGKEEDLLSMNLKLCKR